MRDQAMPDLPGSEGDPAADLERGVALFNEFLSETAARHGVDLLLHGMTLGPDAATQERIDYLVLPRNGPRMKVRIQTGLFVRMARGSRLASRRLRALGEHMLLQLAPRRTPVAIA